MSYDIFPRALVNAARTFAAKPAVVGEVLVALVERMDGERHGTDGGRPPHPEGRYGTDGGRPPHPQGRVTKGLTDVQRYILSECVAEIAERAEVRRNAAERKRRQRAK